MAGRRISAMDGSRERISQWIVANVPKVVCKHHCMRLKKTVQGKKLNLNFTAIRPDSFVQIVVVFIISTSSLLLLARFWDSYLQLRKLVSFNIFLYVCLNLPNLLICAAERLPRIHNLNLPRFSESLSKWVWCLFQQLFGAWISGLRSKWSRC